MADGLAVWLDDLRVADIYQERRRLRLVYTEEAMHRYALGVPLLSLSLPLTGQRYPHGVVRAFLDGLLPESWIARRMPFFWQRLRRNRSRVRFQRS